MIIAKCTHPDPRLCERRMSHEHFKSKIVHCVGDPKMVRFYRICEYRKEEEVTIRCASNKECDLNENGICKSTEFDTCFSQGTVLEEI